MVTLWFQLPFQPVVRYGHIIMLSPVGYEQKWGVVLPTLDYTNFHMCSSMGFVMGSMRRQYPEWLWKTSVEDTVLLAAEVNGRKRPIIFQPISPGLEWKNKQETMTKIPLCLNYCILDLLALWPSIDFWSKWCFMLVLWSSLICCK